MKLALFHARAATIELVRLPAYLVPTLGFPAMFFLFFAVPRGEADAAVLMALFAGFAVLGVAFFQFGVGIAAERATPWERYLRTLPISPSTRFLGRVLSAIPFATAAAGAVIAVSLATSGAHLRPAQWIELLVALAASAVPFSLLGIAIGYLASPRAALPVANVLYLGLSYAGGLWTTPPDLPDTVQAISSFLPTRALAETLAGIATQHPRQTQAWIVLAAYAAVFALVAAWAYRRDEGQRYR